MSIMRILMSCQRRRAPFVALLVAGLLLGSQGAPAATYVPDRDDAVVERLRDRPLDPTDRELRRLRAALRRAPGQVQLAVAVAQRCLATARRDGDPRYIGYAEAALGPWWRRDDMPGTVRLLKATLLQSVHEFGPALDELRVLHQREPGNAQAWLTSAAILRVQGRYAEAAAACARLTELGVAPVYAQACAADLEGLRGAAEAAAGTLARLHAEVPAPAGWLDLMEAELAERRGRFDEAKAKYQRALQGGPDAYTRAAYADFLLDRGRGAEVIALLAGSERADPLLLRLALAYRQRADPRLAAAVADLQARFDAARLRGDRVHLREEARFELALRGRPDHALPLALANWAVQKEPADLRILLECARAAGSQEDEQVGRQFLARNRIVDVRLGGPPW
jgi:tetratricopeptide (TPR) repeat protein